MKNKQSADLTGREKKSLPMAIDPAGGKEDFCWGGGAKREKRYLELPKQKGRSQHDNGNQTRSPKPRTRERAERRKKGGKREQILASLQCGRDDHESVEE